MSISRLPYRGRLEICFIMLTEFMKHLCSELCRMQQATYLSCRVALQSTVGKVHIHKEEGGKPSSEFHWSAWAMTNQSNYGTYLWP